MVLKKSRVDKRWGKRTPYNNKTFLFKGIHVNTGQIFMLSLFPGSHFQWLKAEKQS